MRWSIVRAEPSFIPLRSGTVTFEAYHFRLPLLADGRLAFTILVREPGRAVVERIRDGAVIDRGLLRLIDNQWTCVWQPERQGEVPHVRLIGSRFAMGDSFGVRPVGGTMQLFEVRGIAEATLH